MNEYKNCSIHYDHPPIPSCAGCDYSWSHEDYDGAPDGNDNRCGMAGSLEECYEQIDEMYAELEADNREAEEAIREDLNDDFRKGIES